MGPRATYQRGGRRRREGGLGGGFASSWIRPTTRLAIYLRDGLACLYCGRLWRETGTGLTIDHVVPRGGFGGGDGADREDRGTNDPANLVTACRDCNRQRQTLSAPAFARWLGISEEEIRDRIVRARDGEIDRKTARALHADPPEWLRDLRVASTMLPGDQRRWACGQVDLFSPPGGNGGDGTNPPTCDPLPDDEIPF